MPLAAPVLFLGSVEAGLRIAGAGYEASFFLPHPEDGSRLVTNPRYGERFFPRRIARTPAPVVFAGKKSPGTLRVFVLGESAAMGFPDPVWGFARQLELILRGKTGGQVEVINAAMTAIDSRIVREIAMECALFEPDWFVVYMGNNEFIGPFAGSSEVVAWTRMMMARMRLGQWLLARTQPSLQEWKGLETFRQNRITADDARVDRTYRAYRQNLLEIAQAGRKAGAKVILSTVAVNLRDCPPFAGDAARQAYSRGEFEKARDWDELRLRASSAVNRIVGEVARETGAIAIDAAGALHADARHFYEHVHLNPEGNRALARLIAGAEAGTLEETAWDRARMMGSIAALTARPPFSLQQGHEAFQKHVEAEARAQRAAMDYTAAIANYNVMQRKEPDNLMLRERYAELLRESGRAEASVTEWRELIRRLPLVKNWHTGLAEAMLSLGRPKEAQEAAQRALELDSEFTPARLQIGLSRAQMGDLSGAVEEFEIALRSDPDSADAHNNLGVAFSSQGRRGEALAAYRKAIAARPNFARAHDNLARLMVSSGQIDEAMAEYRAAIDHDPRLVSAQYDLGVLLARSGELDAAIMQYERVLALQPGHADAHNNLGTALARTGRMAEAIGHFEEALRIEPAHAEARKNLILARRR